MKKARLCYIIFDDHAMSSGGHEGLIECQVIGYLIKQDKSAYYVVSWLCNNDPEDHNSEIFTIAKGATKKIRFLKEA